MLLRYGPRGAAAGEICKGERWEAGPPMGGRRRAGGDGGLGRMGVERKVRRPPSMLLGGGGGLVAGSGVGVLEVVVVVGFGGGECIVRWRS